MFRLILIIIGLMLAGPAAAQNVPAPTPVPTSAQWRQDLEAAADALRLRHPDPFTRIGRREFMRRLQALEEALPALTEEQRGVRALQLFAAVGEGHTNLDLTGAGFRSWYPIRLYEFTDGIYIVSARREQAGLAGARVIEIGGRPAREAVDLARTLIGADNDIGALENVFAASNAGLMRGLGLTAPDGSLQLRVRRAGQRRDETVPLQAMAGYATMEWRNRSEVFGVGFGDYADWISAYRALPATAFRTPDPTRPPHLVYRRHFIAVPLPQRDAYYIQVNYMLDAPDETLADFFHRALAEVDRQRPHRLIVDLRYNSGGDGSKIPSVIHQFIAREAAPPWRELFVLTGRKTFSAAVNLVEAFREHVPASFVGEPAGAGFRHAGNAEQLLFPGSGLQLYVSTAWHGEAGPVEEVYTPVDVPAQFSSADYIAGRDPAVDAILGGVEMRALPLIAQAEGAAALRRAYDERRARFGAIGWWRAADMLLLNAAGYHLLGAGRQADALEAFRVNTEIYPDSWYVWDSLGEAQLAAGQRAEGVASYRRSLALNPGNATARRIVEEADRAARPAS